MAAAAADAGGFGGCRLPLLLAPGAVLVVVAPAASCECGRHGEFKRGQELLGLQSEACGCVVGIRKRPQAPRSQGMLFRSALQYLLHSNPKQPRMPLLQKAAATSASCLRP